MIETGHGVVRRANASFTHRNLFNREAFQDFIGRRRSPYAPLDAALAGAADALTFDDATVAAADAARIARAHGHAVTIFVNGYNVAHQVPHFFARLNAILDAANRDMVEFDGQQYPLTTAKAKTKFRKQVKRKLATIGSEAARQDLVSALSRGLGLDAVAVPEHFRTLTVAEIQGLLDCGVEIQNHGWTHTRVGGLSARDHLDDIRRGRDWLRTTFHIAGDIFAVPNGDGRPISGWQDVCRAWLLLDEKPLGVIAPGVVSRRTLVLKTPRLRKLRTLAHRFHRFPAAFS